MDVLGKKKSNLTASHLKFSIHKPEVKWVTVHRPHSLQDERKQAAPFTMRPKKEQNNTLMLSDHSNSSSYANEKRTKVNEYERRRQRRRLCLILLTSAIVAAVLASIAAIILVFTLTPKTTTTTSTTSTTTTTTTSTTSTTTTTTTSTTSTTTTTTSETTTVCTSSGRGNMGLLTGYASTSWTRYSTSFSATKSNYILVFGFQAAVNRSWILDDASVVQSSAPGVQLLNNAKFENSNTSISGWVLWCSSYCHFGTAGQLLVGADCYLGNGTCFTSGCLGPGIEFLGQYFSTNSGSTYTISFRLLVTGAGDPYYTMFYVDIF